MRPRRNDEEGENAAWPGLVDLFAFGMVVMLVMWFASAKTGGRDPLLEKGREVSRALRGSLQADLHSADIVENMDLPGLEVRSYRGQEIYFDTNKFDLSESDRTAISTLGAIVAAAIKNQPAVIVKVNGTADPRPLSRIDPPRNNVELSALRAAEVNQILVSAGLKDRLTVVGLGETGTATSGL
jgi:flagellar motor protein MotB